MAPRRSIIPVFVPHLGCPMNCVFCNQKRITGSLFPATAQTVKDEVTSALARGINGAELAFYGGSFTAIPARMQEELLGAAAEYLAAGSLSAIRLSTRPDAIDGETLARLRRFGVSTVELGAQSMSDAVLLASGRGHSAADTVRAAALIKAAGFQLILQMMTGLPGSGRAEDIATARGIAALRPDGVRIYPTVIIDNTELCDLWRRGEYREHTVEEAVETCADIVPLFEAARIPIIRLGLNPTDELSAGGAVAGAYHPALGELVRSRILLRAARELLRPIPAGSAVTLGVRPGRVSAMTGQHRANITALEREFSLRSLRVAASAETKDDEIVILAVAN